MVSAMSRAVAFWLVSMLVATGCADAEPTSPEAKQPPTEATTESTTSPTPAIVGRWQQVQSCRYLVTALDKAGLKPLAPAMVGNYFPSSSPQQLAQKPDVCKGAKPQRHSHFFTEDGQFGSLDQHGQQVDDGTYTVTQDVVRIGAGGAEFLYRIVNDKLMLHPVISPKDHHRALENPLEFSEAGWQVAVSYPGLPWKRAPCAGWC
jgi:hypothetical protein